MRIIARIVLLASLLLPQNAARIPGIGGLPNVTDYGPWTLAELVAHTTSASSGTGLTITVGSGDTIIVAGGAYDNGAASGQWTSVTLVGGTCSSGAMTRVIHQTDSTTQNAEIWAAAGCSSSITSAEPIFTGGGSYVDTAYVLSGMPSVVSVDATNTSSGSSSANPQTAASVTSTLAGDFIISTEACFCDTDTSINGAGYSGRGWSGVGYGYITSNSAAAGNYQPSWSGNAGDAYATASAAFSTYH